MDTTTKKTDLPPHAMTPEGDKYMATMKPEQLELHKIAIEMLGSSYFIERTRGFRAWKESTKAK